MLIMNLSTVAIVWFGGHLVGSGHMPIGNLTAFISYIMLILTSVLMAVMMLVMVPRAAVSSERIQQVLVTETAIADPVVPQVPKGPPRGLVEFQNVEYRYPGAEEPVLRDVSFALVPGRTTAVVGSTGSGKSTLINLIPRLDDVTEGAVLIDGLDIRTRLQSDVRSMLGFVPQRSMLFSGTVASNLRFGREDASEDQLWHSLDVAQAREFVSAMPGELDAVIEQGGTNLSGGQRQRLAIARALVRRPQVYIFDDSFSALDFATDARLRTALKGETREASVLIVAQRVSTIMHADQIVVLDAGLVVGLGSHADLMVDCPTYREIVLSQLTEDEVA
jgi:ATP-binding cassette subfamily B protein